MTIVNWQWALLLLPVAFLAGWVLSRRKNKAGRRQLRFSNDYFQGLNYLLNDEQDRALDIFLRLVEVDWETIDTSLALATIFRRKGEIDKSIKLHQNLLARPSLPVDYKFRVLLELGRDYQLAGWLDRAEGLFKEVLKDDVYRQEALKYLMNIYQQEQEWQLAINVAVRYNKGSGKSLQPIIAQFYCELCNIHLEQGDIKAAEALAIQALSTDPSCVRASICLGGIVMNRGRYKKAIRFLQQIEQQNPVYLTLVIDKLAECYRLQSSLKSLIGYLKNIDEKYDVVNLVYQISDLICEAYGQEKAQLYLTDSMLKKPDLKGMKKLLEYKTTGAEAYEIYLPEIIKQMVEQQSAYQCSHCGYAANTLYWLCPTCHSWGGMKPYT
jgi:lipopolysaccharide biosynthesis regulator YciM